MPLLPFKLNQAGRHHIPRQKHKVTNWPAYDTSLRQRGSLTVWFTDKAITAWAAEPRTTRGGQPWYSPLAILTALTLRAVFRLAYRQTEGLIGSIIGLLGLALRVPDHTTLSRRAATLEVPRPSTAVPSKTAESEPTQRDRHLQHIAEHGRMAWQKASGYTERARAEAAIGRWKQVIGDGLRARTDQRRATEVNVAVHALNRMLEFGRPNYVRVG